MNPIHEEWKATLRALRPSPPPAPKPLARALAPMAPPQSAIHQIIQEDDLLAADRARNVNKAERATQANADRALDLQIKFQNLPGAWA